MKNPPRLAQGRTGFNFNLSAACENCVRNTYHQTVASAADFFDFAERNGFALVKVHPGEKRPVGEGWQNLSTRNRAEWEQWLADGFNVGVHAGASRLVIFDLDQKHGGIEAVRLRLDTWCINNGMAALPHQVTTPSGGQHIYLRVPEGVDAMTLAGNTAGALGKGVDVLAGNKQAVAPGSAVGAGRYVFHGAPFYEAPPAVLDFCARAPAEAPHVSKPGTLDKEDVAKFIAWLADHGGFEEYGDWVGLGMALRVEFGDDGKALWAVSHDDTVTPHVIEAKWRSFAADAQPGAVTLASFMKAAHDAGWKGTVRQSTASMFAGLAELSNSPSIAPPLAPGTPGPQAPSENEDTYPTPAGGFMQPLGERLKNFVLPEYLWDGVLIKRFVYSLTAQTGAGKTATALLFAAHVAIGKALCGRYVEKGSIIYFAGENPDDVDMRWLGLCHMMELDPNTLDVHIIAGVVPLSRVADRIRQECEAKHLEPSAVIVDTAAAYFEGDDDNGNVAMGNYARQLRSLSKLPGQPCVLILAHPTKGAKDIGEMVPRGGGAFLNEMDGNLGAARGDGNLIGIQAVGKFRGPEFTPLHFALIPVRDCPALYDAKKGRFLPTVVAQPVSEVGAAARASEGEQDDIRLLQDIYAHPRDDLRKRAPRLGCHHVTVGRRIEKLAKRKLVDDTGIMVRLTAKGQKELNALDEVQQRATSVVPFPVPGRP